MEAVHQRADQVAPAVHLILMVLQALLLAAAVVVAADLPMHKQAVVAAAREVTQKRHTHTLCSRGTSPSLSAEEASVQR